MSVCYVYFCDCEFVGIGYTHILPCARIWYLFIVAELFCGHYSTVCTAIYSFTFVVVNSDNYRRCFSLFTLLSNM